VGDRLVLGPRLSLGLLRPLVLRVHPSLLRRLPVVGRH
jgi:hypothetical protein